MRANFGVLVVMVLSAFAACNGESTPATAIPATPTLTATPLLANEPRATPTPIRIIPGSRSSSYNPRLASPAGSVRRADGEAILVADDGTFLGVFTSNRFDSDSICNRLGDHGSRLAQDSIHNRFSPFGSRFDNLSVFNRFTRTPPKIVMQGTSVGFLTKNRLLRFAVDPDLLLEDWDCVR